jgi:hypothetical protein
MATEIRCRKCRLEVVPAVEPGMPWMHKASQVTWCALPAGPFGSSMADPEIPAVWEPANEIAVGIPPGPVWVAYLASGKRAAWSVSPPTEWSSADLATLAATKGAGGIVRWQLEPPDCPLCHGEGLVDDPTACGDPDHCDGWMSCPAGCEPAEEAPADVPDPVPPAAVEAFVAAADALVEFLTDRTGGDPTRVSDAYYAALEAVRPR